ncbi:MAG TPA: MazG nucleotide pyrophosphohydrolase domain-containing protein [Elusimicrobiota bacterium]|nr:MazG nucleotide pyrophosphohydrolase domain-containing protein [Elusimicrobiota bacterium]
MARGTFNDLIKIMARLRGPGGCPWDRRQTHRSLLRYLREEAGEVARAVRRKDDANLCEELGDVLLQVVFHAQMASERRKFDIRDVVAGLCRKLVRRHPHVFGRKRLKTAAEVVVLWRELKRREKARRTRRGRRG